MKLNAFILGLLLATGAVFAQGLQIERPVRVVSPLYTATIHPQYNICERIEYTVLKDHLGRVNIPRNFYTPKEIRDDCLEASDYTNSGLDRSHLRALSLSCGSIHANDVNCMAVIVPMTPQLNREVFREIEKHIETVTRRHGQSRVTIQSIWLDVEGHTLPQSDEPYVVPAAYKVSVRAANRVHEWVLSNTKTPHRPVNSLAPR